MHSFIYWSVLGCFHSVAIENSTSKNIPVQVFVCLLSTVLRIYLEVELLDYAVIPFWGTSNLSSMATIPVYNSTSNEWGSVVLHITTKFIFPFEKLQISCTCKVEFQCGFFVLFCFFRATPATHGDSQARGRIQAVAAGLCHSHSNARSNLYPWPMPHLATSVP